MLNSALIEILKSLSKEELKSLEDFINSPYHNKKTPAIKLFIYVKKYFPEFKNERLQREKAWETLFPGKEYNYGVMKNLIYDLTKLTEDFISFSTERNDDLKKDLNIIKFLHDRKKTRLAGKYLEKAGGKIKDTFVGDADYYRNIFNIEKIRMSIHYSRISDKHKIVPGKEFELSSRYLIESFLISILENYVMINSLNKIHKAGINMPMLEEIINFIKLNEEFLENFYIKVYHYLLLLDREQDEKYFFILKKMLSEMDDKTDTDIKYSLWENISNYVIFRIHAGESEFAQEQFELNKLALDKKIYIRESEENFFVLNFTTFFNIAMRLNEIEWAEDFLNKYISKLDAKTQDDIKNYCYTGISIKRRKFAEANEYMSRIKKLHEPHMKAGLKLNTLVVYYELGWFEASISVIDSFKHLLDNEKNIQEVIKEKFRKFIKGYAMLIDIKYKKDKSDKLKLERYLNETEGIGSMGWLSSKLSEIEGKN